jgi:hypothetical protein
LLVVVVASPGLLLEFRCWYWSWSFESWSCDRGCNEENKDSVLVSMSGGSLLITCRDTCIESSSKHKLVLDKEENRYEP